MVGLDGYRPLSGGGLADYAPTLPTAPAQEPVRLSTVEPTAEAKARDAAGKPVSYAVNPDGSLLQNNSNQYTTADVQAGRAYEKTIEAGAATAPPTPPATPPIKWNQIAQSPKYLDLTSEVREQVRNQYFRDVVAPNVPTDQLETVKQQFDTRTRLSHLDRFLKPATDFAVGMASAAVDAISPDKEISPSVQANVQRLYNQLTPEQRQKRADWLREGVDNTPARRAYLLLHDSNQLKLDTTVANPAGQDAIDQLGNVLLKPSFEADLKQPSGRSGPTIENALRAKKADAIDTATATLPEVLKNIEAVDNRFNKSRVVDDKLKRSLADTYRDLGADFMSGVAGVSQAVGQGEKFIGLEKLGQALVDEGDTAQKYWAGLKTPKGQQESGKKFLAGGDFSSFGGAINTLASGNWDFGDATLSTVGSSVAQSAPGMVAMGGVGKLVSAGLIKSGATDWATSLLARTGAPLPIAEKVVDFAANGVAFGGAEGVFSGLQNAAQTGIEIRKMEFDKLKESPAFRQFLSEQDSSLPEKERLDLARKASADAAEAYIFTRTLATTGGTSAITGGGIFGILNGGRQLAKSASGNVVKGVASEFGQEFVQSGLEQYWQNMAKQKFADPSQDASQDVAEQSLHGGVVGAAMGLGGGAAPHAKSEKSSIGAASKPKLPGEARQTDSSPIYAGDVLGTIDQTSQANAASTAALPQQQATDSPLTPTNSAAKTAASAPINVQTSNTVEGDKINKEWTAFSPESGTLNIPRADMPQVAAAHRGPLVNFLNARGVTHEQETFPSSFTRDGAERRADGGQRKVIDAMTPAEKDSHIAELRQALDVSQKAELTDKLTGLPNRNAYDKAERLPVQSRVDLDGFKTINDTFGHDAGDEVLKAVATHLQASQGNGRVFRIGGDEFPGEFSTPAEATKAMEFARQKLARQQFTFQLPDGSKKTISGVGFSYGHGETAQAAESALIADKAQRAADGLRARDRASAKGNAGVAEGQQADQGVVTPVLQNRNRSDAAYIQQVNSIAKAPDADKLSFSRNFSDGAPVVTLDSEKIPPSQLGKTERVKTAQGREIPIQYAVVEASSLLPSNTADGSVNKGYATGETGKIRVVAGNGRVAGIQKAYTQNTFKDYRSGIRKDEGLHGVSSLEISKLKKPVLVRIMSKDDITANIGDESNDSGVSKKSPLENAKDDSARLDLTGLEFGDDGVTSGTLRQFVSALPISEQTELLLPDGTPTKQARDRLMAAIFWKAYGSESLVRIYSQAVEPESANIINGLAAASPNMIQLEGAGALDIREIISEAAEIAVSGKRKGMTLDQVANQSDINVTPEIQAALKMFAANARSGKKIGEILNNVATDAYNESIKPSEDMFGAVEKRDRAQILEKLNDTTSAQDVANQGGVKPVQRNAERPRLVEAQRDAPKAETNRAANDSQESVTLGSFGKVPSTDSDHQLTLKKQGNEYVLYQGGYTVEDNLAENPGITISYRSVADAIADLKAETKREKRRFLSTGQRVYFSPAFQNKKAPVDAGVSTSHAELSTLAKKAGIATKGRTRTQLAAALTLQNQTRAELQAKKDNEEKAAADKAKADQDAEKAANERAYVAKRNEAAANDYQLGQSAEDNLSGQRTMFSRADQTKTAAFKNWFGASKVVDKDGNPLRVYHGTDADFATFLDSMLGKATGAKSAAVGHYFVSDSSIAVGYAHHAANDAPVRQSLEHADFLERKAQRTNKQSDWDAHYAAVEKYEALDKEIQDNRLRGQNVMPVYLSLQNPATFDAGGSSFVDITKEINQFIRQAKRDGKDGVILKNLDDDPGFNNRVADHYVIFKSEQVKSAIGNNGQFDPNNPDIRYSKNKEGVNSPNDFPVNESNREYTDRLEAALRDGGDNFKATPVLPQSEVNDGRERGINAGAVETNIFRLAEKVAGVFGKQVVWMRADGDFVINAVMTKEIANKIFVDVRSETAPHVVMGHELSHWMEFEAPGTYAALMRAMQNVLIKHEQYRVNHNIPARYTKDQLSKEMVGDLMGDAFMDTEFFKLLAKENPGPIRGIANKIMQWLNDTIAKFSKLTGFGSAQYVNDLKAARTALAKAVAEYATLNGRTSEKDANALYQQAYSDLAPKFHRAWHGSPHDHDGFSMDKIGSGEGAQAYGYGHYFAGNKAVADHYKNTLSNRGRLTVKQGYGFNKTGWFLVDPQNNLGGGPFKTKTLAESMIQKGKLYEVELAPKEDEYLDWDKPLSEQSEKVRDALKSAAAKLETDESFWARDLQSLDVVKTGKGKPFTGKDLYADIQEALDSRDSKDASLFLKSIGIPGIRYLDGSSRTAGEGNHNYVIFDDKDVSITAKFSRQSQTDSADGGRVSGVESPYNDSLKARLANAKRQRDEGGSLADYGAREQAEWLRGQPVPKSGELKIYRAVSDGNEILAGDYVTNSRQYANDHIKNNMAGNGRVIETTSNLDEIFPADAPGEFWYLPRSLDTQRQAPLNEGLGTSGGKQTDSAAFNAEQAAFEAANEKIAEQNEFDIAEEVRSIQQGGNVRIEDMRDDPKFWDAENDEPTEAGYKEADRRTEEQAKQNVGVRGVTELSDLNSRGQSIQVEAMEAYADALGLYTEKSYSSGGSRYLNVRIDDQDFKFRFADHYNTVRSTPDQPDFNVAPGRSEFTDAVAYLNRLVRNAAPANSSDASQGTPQSGMQERAGEPLNGQREPAQAGDAGGGKRDITANPNFRKWFGDSKVVNPDGTPMVGREQIAAHLYKSGQATAQELADAVSVHTSTIYQWINENDSGRSKREAQGIPDWYVDEAISMYQLGSSSGFDALRDADGITFSSDADKTRFKRSLATARSANGNFDGSNPDIRFSRAAAGTQTTVAPVRTEAPTNGPADFLLKNLGGKLVRDYITQPVYDRVSRVVSNIIPEKVKQGLASNYGLSEPYLNAKIDREIAINKLVRESRGLIDEIQSLDRAQARVAYVWMTENPNLDTETSLMQTLPADAKATLKEMKQLVSDMGKEAVRLGLMSQDVFERNNLAYLHRSYMKYETAQTQAARSRAAALRGENFKGRGLRDDVTMDAIDAPNIKRVAGKADTGISKQKFIRVEQRKAQNNEALPGFSNPLGKLLAVAYVPADAPIPQKYTGWRQDGVWEARFFDKPGKVGMWRDFTGDERAKMGEIDEVRYAFAKTMLGMVHDVETARFLDWTGKEYGAISEGQVIEKGGKLVDTSDHKTSFQTFDKNDWVKVPETSVVGTGLKKYGALAGQYLPGVVWNDIRQTINLRADTDAGKLWDSMMRMWKVSKTALSPAVHTNNVMSNLVMADMVDVHGRDLIKALTYVVKAKRGDADAVAFMNRYQDSGAELGSYASIELNADVVEPLLKSLEGEVTDAAGSLSELAKGAQVMSLAFHGELRQSLEALKLTSTARLAVVPFSSLIKLYQSEDKVFRLAKFIREVDHNGKTDRQAGDAARLAFLDYQINAPWIAAARRGPLPFVAFSYRAIPLMITTFKDKPWKLAKYMAVGAGLNALSYAMLGLGGDDEDKERRKLPKELQGRTIIGTPRLMRMPWNDEQGNPVFLDTRRWIPAGDMVDLSGSKGAIALPSWLSLGGPLAMVSEIATNKSIFTGQPIHNESDTVTEKTAKLFNYFYKWLMPNLPIPNPLGYGAEKLSAGVPTGFAQTYSTTKIQQAVESQTDRLGRQHSLAEASLSAIGVKLAAYPENKLMLDLKFDVEAKLAEIDRVIRKISVQRFEGGLSEAEASRRVEYQLEKKKALVADVQKKIQ